VEETIAVGKGKTEKFTSQGSLHFGTDGNTAQARTLKTTRAKNPILRWQNAESIAASATEIFVIENCPDVANVVL
jgi:hypothetical protein